jgi:enoyl-CoA hydratase/carnithine racemase
MELTEAQFDELPPLRSKDLIKQLRAIHIHRSLKSSPATVETESGHFRLSPALSVIAARAYATGNAYEGSTAGRLGMVLRRVAFGADDSASETVASEEASDALEAVAARLAREALRSLEEATARAARQLYAQERSRLLEAAVGALTTA